MCTLEFWEEVLKWPVSAIYSEIHTKNKENGWMGE